MNFRLPILRSFLPCPLLLALLAVSASQHTFAQLLSWSSVRIGGGGYVTGLIIHPLDGNLLYARTDVGGAYRWDAATASWIPLTDWIPPEHRNLYGIESIALDPSDTNIVYMACGLGTALSQHGVYRSNDRGATWTGPYLTNVRMAANDWGYLGVRAGGERLVVDPNKRSVLYFGSRWDGLWKTTDSGSNWNRVTSIPDPGWAGRGVTFVAIDPTSGSPGVESKTVYIGVFGHNRHRLLDFD